MSEENRRPLSAIETTQIKNAVSGNSPQDPYQQSIPLYPSSEATQDPRYAVPPSIPPVNSGYSQYPQEQNSYSQGSQSGMTQELSPSQSGMSPSLMSSPDMTQEFDQSQQPQTSSIESFQSDPYQNLDSYGSEYQPYSSISPETINEIAESIVSERISPIKRKIEQALDSKTEFESKLSSMDERLKRIEKIIDKLQLSILERVGQYVNDVSDLKKEIIETQKTFKSVNSSSHHSHTTHHKNKK